MEKSAIVVDEEKITNIMNNYFIDITKSLNLKPFDKSKVDIDMFENHISIKKNTRNLSEYYSRELSLQTSIQRSGKKKNTQPKR